MLQIKKETIGELTVFQLSGRIDAMNANQLRDILQAEVDVGNGGAMLLNMDAVNYLSAAGLRVLNRIKERAGRVVIAEPSKRVRDVMQITGLDIVYNLFSTQTDALHFTRPIVNAHTHLEVGFLAHHCPDVRGAYFPHWLKAYTAEFHKPKPVSYQTTLDAAHEGAQAMLEAGITTVGDISETGASLQALVFARMNGIVYLEVLGRTPDVFKERFEKAKAIIDEWRPKLKGGLQIGLAPHAPYSLSKAAWTELLAYSEAESLPLCIHAAETYAEVQYIRNGTGAFAEIYTDAPPLGVDGMSPIVMLEEVGALAQSPLLVHCVHVDDDDIARIKQSGSRVVHCPRSNLRLRAGRMPLEKFLAADIPVLLGTDSLASSPSLNIFDEVDVAAALHYGKVTPQRILSMVHRALS